VATVLVVIVLGVGGWSLYELGLRHGGYHARQARATEAHLRIDVSDLREQVSKLADRNTLLERAERIEREAREDLRGVIEKREQRISHLKEELAFYRNLVSPSDMEPGLHVRRLEVAPVAGSPGVFRYELVLTQINGSDRYCSGHIDFTLVGRRSRDRVEVGLDELAVSEESPETFFRFKYFQTLTGQIRVPDGVEPARLLLRVNPEQDRLDPLKDDYPWKSLISESDGA